MTSAKAFLAVTTEDIAYQENEELFGISTNNSLWVSRLRSQVGQLCDMNAVSLRALDPLLNVVRTLLPPSGHWGCASINKNHTELLSIYGAFIFQMFVL